MSNDYKDEFDAVCTVGTFWDWIRSNNNTFYCNMNLIRPSELLTLREWIALFLKWTEYEENKDGNKS